MKGYRFIYTKQSIASYMAGFNTKSITYKELNNWCEYLSQTLSTEDYQAIVFYGKRYLDELQREDDGFLFVFGDDTIRLARGKTKHDLDEHILAYVDADTLMALLQAPKGYKKNKEEQLTI